MSNVLRPSFTVSSSPITCQMCYVPHSQSVVHQVAPQSHPSHVDPSLLQLRQDGCVLLVRGSADQRRDAAEVHRRMGGRQGQVGDTGSGGHEGAGRFPVVEVVGPPCDQSGTIGELM